MAERARAALECAGRLRLPAIGERPERGIVAAADSGASTTARLRDDGRGGDENARRADVYVSLLPAAIRNPAEQHRRDRVWIRSLRRGVAALCTEHRCLFFTSGAVSDRSAGRAKDVSA